MSSSDDSSPTQLVRLFQRPHDEMALPDLKPLLIDDAVQAEHGFRTLRYAVTKLAGIVEAESSTAAEDLLYFWDWDAVYEVIHPKMVDSVYAEALNYVRHNVRTGRLRSGPIVLPQGTREELVRFLRQQVTRSGERLSRQDLNLTGDQQVSTSWRDTLKLASSLRNVATAVTQLQEFLSTDVLEWDNALKRLFGRRTHPELSIEQTPEYLTYLADLQRARGTDATLRNHSDAANLAQIAVLNKMAGAVSAPRVYLVTGTRLLREIEPRYTLDPLFYLFKLEVESRTPGREALRNQLDLYHHALSSAIVRLKHLTSEATPASMRDVIFAVKVLWEQPAIREVTQPFFAATEAAHNKAYFTALTAPGKLLPPHARALDYFEQLAAAADAVVETPQLDGIAFRSFDLSVERRQAFGPTRGAALMDSRVTEPLLSCETRDDLTVCRWQSSLSLATFIERVAAIADGEIRMKWFTEAKPPLEIETLDVKKIRDVLRKITGAMRPDLIKVTWSKKSVYYQPISENLSQPAVVATVGRTDDVEHVCTMYRSTFRYFLPTFILKRYWEELVK